MMVEQTLQKKNPLSFIARFGAFRQFPRATPAAAVAAVFSRPNSITICLESLPLMATCTGSLYTCCCTRYSSRNVDNSLFPKYRRRSSQFPLSISFSSLTYSPSRPILARALSSGDKSSSISGKKEQKVEEERGGRGSGGGVAMDTGESFGFGGVHGLRYTGHSGPACWPELLALGSGCPLGLSWHYLRHGLC
ncbi:UNVERIFIED_CONTAM: hypothetical protein Sangu_1754900 [Sesamum angustifolium]|uniref:Uncharacterized protein n=1 Tax=Sesamum angustifolium TaxID=2727405 RepID=A0AAW2M773_9LAMI